jgi:hypothetical protein
MWGTAHYCAAHSGGSGPRPRGAARMLDDGDFTDEGGGRLRARSGSARLGRRDGRGGGAYWRGIGWAEGAAATRCTDSEAAGNGEG